MNFEQATTEHRKSGTVFLVEDREGRLHTFKSAGAANAAFPGAFDEPDGEEDAEHEHLKALWATGRASRKQMLRCMELDRSSGAQK